MKKLNLLKDIIREHMLVATLIAIMTIVYVITMFTNKPWYDELYTYYYFISRGPVYAAIHWPVPNNHVGYSVLSACLDIFGYPYIGLRGISCIAAVANLILIYYFSCKFMNKYLSTAVTALYAGAYLIHRLSVQGRGYTLAVTCYLVALITLHNICFGEHLRRNYIIFGAALTLGLYIVPSSVYWVIPTCVTGGLFLLLRKNYKRFSRLLAASLAAAVVTLILYSLIWLAIGANLISKDPEDLYYGIHQAKIVLKAPFRSLKTGLDYMLATPYIQSIKRSECIRTMPEYFKDLFDNYYSFGGITIFMTSVCLIICSFINAFTQIFYRRSRFLGSLYVFVTLITVPLMLLVQSVQPYLRVLSFYVIPIIFGTIHTINIYCESFAKGRLVRRITLVTLCLSLLLGLGSVARPYYREPLADRENKIEGALKGLDVSSFDSVYFTDDYAKYVLKFYHDVTPVECETIADAGYAIFCPEMYDSKYKEPQWPVLYGYHMARLNYAESRMVKLSEYEGYNVYAVKERVSE